MADLIRNTPDDIQRRLKQAVEVEERAYLWIPADAITFVPALLEIFYGDGRALFFVGTINQRPRYWVIRGDSSWSESGSDHDFGEFVDEIITDLEEEFGPATCGYCGQGLSGYSIDDPPECSEPGCDAKDALEAGCDWPSVDANGGCHWGSMRWPPGFDVVENPLDYRGNFLSIGDL